MSEAEEEQQQLNKFLSQKSLYPGYPLLFVSLSLSPKKNANHARAAPFLARLFPTLLSKIVQTPFHFHAQQQTANPNPHPFAIVAQVPKVRELSLPAFAHPESVSTNSTT